MPVLVTKDEEKKTLIIKDEFEFDEYEAFGGREKLTRGHVYPSELFDEYRRGYNDMLSISLNTSTLSQGLKNSSLEKSVRDYRSIIPIRDKYSDLTDAQLCYVDKVLM